MREILIVLIGCAILDVQASAYVPVPFDDKFFYPIIIKNLCKLHQIGNTADLEDTLFDPKFDMGSTEFRENQKIEVVDIQALNEEEWRPLLPISQAGTGLIDPIDENDVDFQVLLGELASEISPSKKRKRPIPNNAIIVQENISNEVSALPRPMFNEIGQIIGPPSEAEMGGLTVEQKSNILKIADFTWREKCGINTANEKLQWIQLYQYLGISTEITSENLRVQLTTLRSNITFLENFSAAKVSTQTDIVQPIFDDKGEILFSPTPIDVEGLTAEQQINVLSQNLQMLYDAKKSEKKGKRIRKINNKELQWILFYLYKSKSRTEIARSVNIHPDSLSGVYGCLKTVVPDLQASWDKAK
jgi:hypothetical protein